MITYAIKIDNGYFKDYQYADVNTTGRHQGNTALGTGLQEGDIVDVITTEEPVRIETKRSLGSTITTIYGIGALRNKKIEIVPIEC